MKNFYPKLLALFSCFEIHRFANVGVVVGLEKQKGGRSHPLLLLKNLSGCECRADFVLLVHGELEVNGCSIIQCELIDVS